MKDDLKENERRPQRKMKDNLKEEEKMEDYRKKMEDDLKEI
jgi:hypothetical protein